jgi:peptidoglycan/LPS O-acetylase OafA/YrhL
VYFEKLQRGLITGSYAKFYPSVWDFIPYPKGTLHWSHMWFVVYLFVFCILLLPVFALFKMRLLQAGKDKLANRLSGPVAAFALVLPLTVYYYTLYLPFPEQQSLLDDWFLFIFSLTLLCFGYLLGASNRFWESCARHRFYFAGIALTCIVLLFYKYWWAMQLPKKQNADLYLFGALSAAHIWSLILAVLGFAKQHLNFSNRFLRYAGQAVYPFYILHQTIIVAAGYYVVQWPLPVFVKLPLLMMICFSLLLLLYHFLIKRFLLTRILYGLKWKTKNKEVAPVSAGLVSAQQ